MAIKKLEKELVSLKESVQDQNRQNRGARPFIRILYRQEHTPWLMLIHRMWEWHISGIRSLRAPILLVVARPKGKYQNLNYVTHLRLNQVTSTADSNGHTACHLFLDRANPDWTSHGLEQMFLIKC